MINPKRNGGNSLTTGKTYRPSAALMVAGTYQAWVDGVYQPAKRDVTIVSKPCRPHRQPAPAYL